MGDIAEKMRVPVLARPRATYQVPERCRQFETDPRSVTVSPLTVGEEVEAHKAAALTGNEAAALTPELLRRFVRKLDGRDVDWSTTDPEWIDRCSPLCRETIGAAFLRWHMPRVEDRDAFLASEVVEVR